MQFDDDKTIDFEKPKHDVLYNVTGSRETQPSFYEKLDGYFIWSFDKMPWRVCTTYGTIDVHTDTAIIPTTYSHPGTLYASTFTDKENADTSDVIGSNLICKGYAHNLGWFKKSNGEQYDDVEPFEQTHINQIDIPTQWNQTSIISNKSYDFILIKESPIIMSILNSAPSSKQGTNSHEWFDWNFSYNIPIFKTTDECVLYVNGLIDESTAILPPPEKDDNNENDDNGNNNSDDEQNNTPTNIPQVVPWSIKGGANYYTVTSSNIQAFISWLWNDIIKEDNISDFLFNSLTGICNNLYQCITSLILLPVNVKNKLHTVTNTPINLGRYSSQLEVLDASSYHPKIGECSYDFKSKYNNFLDYPPYVSAMVYLPYVGFKPIDLNVFIPKTNKHDFSTMIIECYVDITTGTVDYMIFRKSEKGKALVSTFQGTCGITIPMSYDTGSSMLSNMSGNLIKQGISTIATKGANLVGDVGNLVGSFDTPSNVNIGAPTPSNGLYYPQNPIVIINRPTYDRPDTYGKNIGYPCFKSYTLRKLSGFTKVINPKLTFGDTKIDIDDNNKKRVFPTETEINEIKELLENGVIL